MWKALVALVFGEALAIWGELIAAKGSPWLGGAVGFVGYPLLIFGYWAGYKAGGIWQVTAVSLGSILVVEPIMVLATFKEVPSRGALIGCLLGAIGMIVSSVWGHSK